MLVLTVKEGKSLIIEAGDDVIDVKILSVNGRQVRVGVDAPRHIAVDREEIYNRKKTGGRSHGKRR